MDNLIYLKPEPSLRWKYSYASPGDEGQQPLFMNPCVSFLSEEDVEYINSLPKEQQATPGRYYIKDKNETDVVRLFVDKCPDGTVQNIKQARCEARPGQDLQLLCGSKSPVSGKNMIEMLKTHIDTLKKQQPE